MYITNHRNDYILLAYTPGISRKNSFNICIRVVFCLVTVALRNLNHLRFADDIVWLSNDIHKLVDMMNEIVHALKQVGLKMNNQKSKIMSREHIAITID